MARRDHTPVSEGQRQLLALNISQRKLGESCGVSHQTAHRWLSGVKAPLQQHRLKIAEVFGVEPRSWDLAPEAQTIAASLATRLRAAADAADASIAATLPLPDSAEGLDSLIAQCRAGRTGADVSPAVLAKLGAIEVRACAERQRMRAAVEIALRSEEGHQFIDGMLEKLEHHPLAMIALCRGELEASATPARLADYDKAYQAWRERWPAVVADAERSNAALLEVLPPHCRFDDVRPEFVHAAA